MSAGWVIDSSVGFAWIHPAQATPKTDSLLNEVANGVKIIVPGLWFLEMANGLLILQRRGRLAAAQRRIALETLAALPLTPDEPSTQTAFAATSELAEKHGLTVYDATYLELAIRRKLPLATRDEPLLAAARRCGLRVL